MSRLKRYVTYKHFKDHDYEITSKINVIKSTKKDEIVEKNKSHTIRGAIVSLNRAYKNLHDTLRANTWSYFLTLTFDKEKVDRLNDDLVLACFKKWRKSVKRKFPDMIYLAVPEYHKKGGLHYHLVVGNITSSELNLIDSGCLYYKGNSIKKETFLNRGYKFDLKSGDGMIIYNVAGFSSGFSTATEIRSSDAVTHYVSKYITKNNIDPRFFNKPRYYVSHNLHKVKKIRDVYDMGDVFCDEITFRKNLFDSDNDIESAGGILTYSNDDKKYDYYSVDLSKESIIKARLDGILPMPSHHLPFDKK